MKTIWLICCLLIGFAAVNHAQGTQATVGAPEEKAKGLQEQLKLTDEQTTKIAAIYKEADERCEKIKKDMHGNHDKMVIPLRPLRAATIKKIEGVLTPAQTVKFQAMLKQTAKDMRSGSKSGIDWSVVCY
jgi:periplasmic protein CpxP/Spy